MIGATVSVTFHLPSMRFFRATFTFVLLLSLPVCAQEQRSLIAELDGTFTTALANPAAYEARVKQECGAYPEGDLLPFTFIASAWCHLIFQNPANSTAKLPLIESALDLALKIEGLKTPDATSKYGGHLARLGMALATYRLAGGNRSDLVAVEEKIIGVLTEQVTAKNGLPINSYPNEIRPLDTSIAVFAIDLHHRVLGSDQAAPLINAHRNWLLEDGIDSQTGLPGSELPGEGQVGPARGSDLSWRLALWSELDKTLSQKWYQIYRTNYWKKATVAQGFREWGSGDLKRIDYRSGPILADIGGNATVIGLCACLSHNDKTASDQIFSQADKLAKSRRSRDFISRILAKTMDSALRKSGIEPVPGFISGFLYGDAMAFYAVTWSDYPDRPVGQ